MPIIPKYFFRLTKSLHLFETHCAFLPLFNPNIDLLQAVKVTKSGHHLSHDRASKGYGSIPCLTSQTSLHACSQRLKDVRTHCYCASLVRTLFIRHSRATSFSSGHHVENSTKYKADDLCVNLVCEYFCWMLGDPHFFFGRSLPFLILSIILKNKKNLCVGSFNISHLLFSWG